MNLYPTIELQNGRCVSLTRGRIEEASIWHVDPVEKAKEFARSGATWMHLTDFNAIDGDDGNAGLVEEIIRSAGLAVQLAGGVRTYERAESWISKGVGRVVLGTAAVKDPQLVKKLAKFHPDQIVIAIDVWNGRVLTDGWREESMFTAEGLLDEYAGVPLAAVIYTDVNADVEGVDANVSQLAQLAGRTRLPIIASGLVRTLDDLSMLKYAGHCDGALVGRALFEKSVELGAALALSRPDVAPRAAFQ